MFLTMRILIVTPLIPPEPGGPSYYSVSLKEALERAGHTVDLIAFREVRQYASGVRHIIFFYKVLHRALFADALIVLDTVSVALPAVVAGWTLGKKTIIRTGGDFVWEAYVERTGEKVLFRDFYAKPRALSRKERFLVWVQKRVVFRLAHTIVFSTAWQRDIWLEPYGIPDTKTVVVENVHTVRQTSTPDGQGGSGLSGPHSEEKGVTRTPTTFLWVGRDLVLKNVDTLCAAFERVKERHPQMELKLCTNIPREEIMREFCTARCLVLPSVSEVSPNIVFEALAHGVPVICTADTGIREHSPAGVVFVETTDEHALTEAMLDLCDPSTYVRVREFASTQPPIRTYDAVAQELLNILSTPQH